MINMSLAVVYSRAKVGVEAPLVTVEVHLSNGLPTFSIVGLYSVYLWAVPQLQPSYPSAT
jgi:hypothetical protein